MAARRLPKNPVSGPSARLPKWALDIPGPNEPLPDLIQQFLAWLQVQKNRPATTLRSYRQDLAKFVAFIRTHQSPSIGLIDQIDRKLLRTYQLELAQLLPNPRSRARALVALRQFLGYAYDQEWTKTEWSRQVNVPRYVVSDPHPIATESVPRLLAALPKENLRDLRDRALIHFLISSGCRIGEACALDRQQIRAEGFRVLGKGGKYRSVYCTEETLIAIKEYLDFREVDQSPALFISVAHADIPKGRVLPNNRLTTDGARRALNNLRHRLSDQHELATILSELHSPHAARHTAATTLLEATEGDVRLVQEVLGHATLETLRVYTEITDKRKRAAYDKLGDYLRQVDT